MKLSITKANSEMMVEPRHKLEDDLVIHCSISFLLSFSAFPELLLPMKTEIPEASLVTGFTQTHTQRQAGQETGQLRISC